MDASAAAEYLLGTTVGHRVADHLARDAGDLHAPHLMVIETVSVLRSWVARGEIESARGASALRDLHDMPVTLWDGRPLLPHVWSLRDNVSAYDALYVALASALDVPLVTTDRRLARAVGSVVTVDLFS